MSLIRPTLVFPFCYNLHTLLMFLSSYDLYGYELPYFLLIFICLLAWASCVAIMSNVKTCYLFTFCHSWMFCSYGASANHILFDHTHRRNYLWRGSSEASCVSTLFIFWIAAAWDPRDRCEWQNIPSLSLPSCILNLASFLFVWSIPCGDVHTYIICDIWETKAR